MIPGFNQAQTNSLMNIMNDMMSIKIKEAIDLQNDQFQTTMNRLGGQIERLHSRMYESAPSTPSAPSAPPATSAPSASPAHQGPERSSSQLASA